MQGSLSVQMLPFFFFYFLYFFRKEYTRDLRSLQGITTTRSRPRTRRREEGGPEKSNCAPNFTQHPHLILVVLLLTLSSNRNKTKDQINCENKKHQQKIKIKEMQVVVYPRNVCEMKTAAECVTYKAVG